MVHRRSGGNRHHGLARAHFRIDDRSGAVFTQQKLQHRPHHFALGGKQRACQRIQHALGFGIRLPLIQRPVLLGNRLKQAAAEIGQKLRQRHFAAGSCFGVFRLHRLGCGGQYGGGFVVVIHRVLLKKREPCP